jgi:hypothetical protein
MGILCAFVLYVYRVLRFSPFFEKIKSPDPETHAKLNSKKYYIIGFV